MASNINPALPSASDPKTQDFRDNFRHLRDEIETLQVTPRPPGATGVTGAVGVTGATGASGVSGAVGATGASGASGGAGGGGPPVIIAASDPVGTANGHLYYNTVNRRIYIRNAGVWESVIGPIPAF